MDDKPVSSGKCCLGFRHVCAIALGLMLSLGGACHRSPARELQPTAPCAEKLTDTTGWRPLTAHPGEFTLLLPANAREIPTQCFDSQCGRIQVGSWLLDYDSGPMAGSGDTLVLQTEAGEMPEYCSIVAGGLRVHLLTFRLALNAPPGYPKRAWRDHEGKLVAEAALRRAPGAGLYLSMSTMSPLETAQFFTAVRTVQVH